MIDGRRARTAFQSRLTQTPRDVLDVDDGVVDDDPDRDDEPRQDHRVDGHLADVQDHRRGHERQRDRDEADQRRPPLEQEHDQDHEDEDAAEDQGVRQVVQRLLDEAGRPEDRVIDVDAGQARAELVEGFLDAARDIERVRPRELLDDEHHARTVVDDRLADERLVILDELDHLGQRDGLIVSPRDRDVGEILDPDDRRDVADDEPLIRGIDESAGAREVAGVELQDPVVQGLGDGIHDVREGDAVLDHLVRDGLDLEHVELLAPDGDVGDAGHAQQPGTDRPVRDHRHVDLRHVL